MCVWMDQLVESRYMVIRNVVIFAIVSGVEIILFRRVIILEKGDFEFGGGKEAD